MLPYPQKAYIILAVVRDMSKTEQAVKAAYDAGVIAGKDIGVKLGIEMGLKRAMDVASRDLHNFKFPEGQIPIGMPLEQHAPSDNSTFEFTYESYEERVKAREAAKRRVRSKRKARLLSRSSIASVTRERANRKPRAAKADDDHGYDELLAEEGVYMKK